MLVSLLGGFGQVPTNTLLARAHAPSCKHGWRALSLCGSLVGVAGVGVGPSAGKSDSASPSLPVVCCYFPVLCGRFRTATVPKEGEMKGETSGEKQVPTRSVYTRQSPCPAATGRLSNGRRLALFRLPLERERGGGARVSSRAVPSVALSARRLSILANPSPIIRRCGGVGGVASGLTSSKMGTPRSGVGDELICESGHQPRHNIYTKLVWHRAFSQLDTNRRTHQIQAIF